MDPSLSNSQQPLQPTALQYHPFIPFFPPPLAVVPNQQIPNFLAQIPNPNPNPPPPPPQAQPQPQNPCNPSLYSPSYTEMINSAIAALNEPDGSSKVAITKYIDRAFSDLPPNHYDLLAHNLKKMKNEGLVVLVNRSYKLPRSDNNNNIISDINYAATTDVADHALPPASAKKGRGRPPKVKPNGPVVTPQPTNGHVTTTSDPINNGTTGSPVVNNFQPVTNNGSVLGKRGRGRPPKNGLLGPKKVPGPGRVARPRKPKSVYSPSPFKRGRGRPAKAPVQASAAPAQALALVPAQPQSELFDAGVSGPSIFPRGRGRPKRNAVVGGVASGAVAGKRRGRPPRAGTVVSPPKPKNIAGSGRPVGRPRKNSSIIRGVAEQVVYEDMKRKFEFFQSKIRQAVGELKPQFTGQSSVSAIAAIQDLEDLASMDINGPLIEDPEPHPVVTHSESHSLWAAPAKAKAFCGMEQSFLPSTLGRETAVFRLIVIVTRVVKLVAMVWGKSKKATTQVS
ncbi:hypothetical protein ACFE04_006836 [Oxalis oulophora]